MRRMQYAIAVIALAIGLILLMVNVYRINVQRVRDERAARASELSALYDRGFFAGVRAALEAHKRGATNCTIELTNILSRKL